jgi:hypothetical protein
MEALKMIPYIALIICIAGIILGASAITMSKFGGTMTECYNGSYTTKSAGSPNIGCNTTCTGCVTGSAGNLNYTSEFYTKYQAQEGISTVAEQQPTIAIIAVMVIIISVIAGVFVYMKLFQ